MQSGRCLQTCGAGEPIVSKRSCLLSVMCCPQFTNVSKDFKGTLDYIFFTSESLVPTSLLDLPDDSLVQKNKASGLPNEHWSSDHIALMAEFQYKQEAA